MKFLLLHTYDIPALVVFLAVVSAVVYDWVGKPEIIKKAMWLLLPTGPVAFAFGWMDELRAYYEFLPILTILMYHSFAKGVVRQPLVRRRIWVSLVLNEEE